MNAFSQALLDDVNRASTKGTLVVASAGNDGQDISTKPYYPAGYSASNLITAAAKTNVDQLANFSNWSATQVHIAAPGVGILTTYPGKGNLTGVTASGGGETGSYSSSYATNASGAPSTNRINNTGFAYDNAGNMTSGSGWNYTYDAANRLTAAGAVGNTYGYDGDGRKVVQNTGGYGNLYYIWSSVLGQPVVEATTGGVYRAYVYGPSGQSLGLLSYDSQFYWVHSDHLGSGRKLTDVNGNVTYRGEFDPHGQTLLEVAPGGTYLNSKKFTGYERNWATNLDDANARTYHHNRARFMQPDPLGLGAADAANPQSLNLYSYVGNDPVNFTDPTGLFLAIPPSSPPDNPSYVGAEFGFGWGWHWGWNTSGGWWGDVGGGGGGGGEEQNPATPNQNKPPVKSKCRPDSPKWDEAVKAFNMVLDPLGFSYAIKDNEWQVVPKGKPNSYYSVIQKALGNGWEHYININPPHWGGPDFEHYYNGMWFHLTIGRPWLSSSPPSWLDIHCEQLFQPSSREHAKDWWDKNVFSPVGAWYRRPF